MEMHQIRYFLAVAEELNFTRAAHVCHVAQPSLSRAIGKLEEEFGGDLFRRERGHTHLTDLGRAMLPMLRQSYEAALAAKKQADSYKGGHFAPLRLGLSLTVGGRLVANGLAELEKAYSGLQVKVLRGTADQLLEALREGDIEIAVAAERDSGWDRFDCWPLFEEGFVLAMSSEHPLADRDFVTFEDLVGEQLMTRPYCEDAERTFAAISAVAEASGKTVEAGHELAADDDALIWISYGLGSALMPASTGGQGEGIGVAFLAPSVMTRKVMLYGVGGRQRSAALGSFITLLRSADWSGYAI